MRSEARLTSMLWPLARNWRRAVNGALTRFALSDAFALPLVQISRAGGGITQIELAKLVGIGGPSLVRLIDRLVAAKLIERREDPSDKRIRRLYLTSSGVALVAQIEVEIDRLRDVVLKDISAEQIDACLQVLDKMQQAIDELGDGAGEVDDADLEP